MSLEIEEWEIWHTYTTFVESTEIDLIDAARRIVDSGIAECAMLNDGRMFWRSDGKVASGTALIEGDSFSTAFKFELRLDKGSEKQPDGFALEALWQAAYFLMSERRVLGDDVSLPSPYVRAYLGKYVVHKASNGRPSELSLYPVLIIYESGILIVEFRMIGPKHVLNLEEFIAGGVNLFSYHFDSVDVSPGLAAFATRAWYQFNRKWNFLLRLALVWLQDRHDLAVKQMTQKDAKTDFSFELTQLSSSDNDDLKSIALTIFHTIAFLIGCPRVGISFLFRGQISAPQLGEFWSGRPHIHLVRFRNQCNTASENEIHHAADFGRIVCRVSTLEDSAARRHLPKNARLFQDYGAYISSASSLWVWSLEGLPSEEPETDPNRANLIYERQVLCELLEYGYMLHRSLYHRMENLSTTAKVMSARREVLRLQHKMGEVSHSGEIRDMLESGWKEMGVPKLLSEIDTGLRLRESETRSVEALRSERVGWALTTVFGFVAVPALAEQVIKPLWKLAKFPEFSDSALTALVADGASLLLVLLILLFSVTVISPRNR